MEVRKHKTDVRDPREDAAYYICKVSTKFSTQEFNFQRTQFVIDDNYIGDPPKVQVSIENLNDNIDENFLKRDLKNYRLKTIEIVRHSVTRQHLGLAKIQFEDSKDAQHCVDTFNGKQVMGKRLSVYLDIKFSTINKKKEEILNPKPITTVPPIIERLPTISPVTPSSITTASTVFASDVASRGRLEDRIAILMRQPGSVLSSIPGLPPTTPQHKSPPTPNQAFQPNNEINKPFDPSNRLNNHISKPFSSHNHFEKSDGYKHPPIIPPTNDYEFEDDKAWNPEPEVEEELPLDIVLTETQINDIVAPFCFDRFFEEIEENLHHTICRKLTTNHGYPTIDNARSEFQSKQNEIRRSEEARLQGERQRQLNREWERRFMTKARIENAENISRPRANFVRQRTTDRGHSNENRRPAFDLKRVNRSSAFVNEPEHGDNRHLSTDSHSIASSASSRRSRSLSRAGSSSRSSSSSSTTTSSSSSSSSSGSSSSSSSSGSSLDSLSRSSSASFTSRDRDVKPQLESSSISEPYVTIARPPAEKAALEALLSLNTGTTITSLEPDARKGKTITKKRKFKEEPIVPSPKKVKKEEKKSEDIRTSVRLTFAPRSQADKQKLIHDLKSIDDEDYVFLSKVHKEFMETTQHEDQAEFQFGSYAANMAHIVSLTEIKDELSRGKQPKWWNGCSRCSVIVSSDKGKVEEATTNFEDLTKAPIKSHVIQAATSTRRDQKSDQRRLAALNPEIDPSFLKTSNTLQMRAKNLRFSRSKIHKWGLFACEKIANGDAVIEYVGEKIRPSLADHREKFVYTNLPTHDGSSYFFRVDTDVIDATLKGNKARFINHCCNPNCIAKVIRHDNGSNSIVIYAKQPIDQDEEITYDYKFPREEQKIKCECKAQNCQGTLN